MGAKGDVTYSENANESGTVSLTLMSTSSSLSYLRDLEAKRRAVNVSITDANDDTAFTMNEDNCRITKMPDVARQKEQATVTVTIFVTSMFKNCVVSPAEVRNDGMAYFDAQEDVKTPEKLIKAIEQFLRE